MKAFIISAEFPYPPNHGGRVDSWNRILAFKKLGIKIYLLTWYGIKKDDIPTDEEIDIVKSQVSELMILPVSRNFRRVLNMIKFPSLVAARILEPSVFNGILLKLIDFCPDFVFIDQIYAGYTGLKFAKKLNLPASVRLHNIEHIYMYGQYKLEKNFRAKLSLIAALHNLRSYENHVLSKVSSFFDISLEDLQYWKAEGYTNGHWLPPFLLEENIIPSTIDRITEEYDIGFIGNLYAPNNVGGVLWFINDVLPLVKKYYNDIKVVIMGSQPTDIIIKACKNNNITLIANPININDYVQNIKILINPVQFGSGVNIKAIDMIFRSNQIVSTSVGIKGLPADIKEIFHIANNQNEFGDAIIQLLNGEDYKNLDKRQEMRKLYDGSILTKFISIMSSKNPN